MRVYLTLEVPAESQQYVLSSARMRRTTPQMLLRAALDVVIRDQLLTATLDDDARPSALTRGPRRGRPMKIVRDASFESSVDPFEVLA